MGTVPVPYSPIAGDDATQARVLTWADAAAYLLGNATSGGSKRPLCVMRQTVAQSIPNNVLTSLLLDVEDVDYDNGHSTVTNTSRYTAATAGWHHVDYFSSWAANATGVRIMALAVNGVALNMSQTEIVPTSGAATCIAASRKLNLSVGDFLEVQVQQTSGAALNTFDSGPSMCGMAVEWRSN